MQNEVLWKTTYMYAHPIALTPLSHPNEGIMKTVFIIILSDIHGIAMYSKNGRYIHVCVYKF